MTSEICSLIIQFALSVKRFSAGQMWLKVFLERYDLKFILVHEDADADNKNAK